MGKSYVKEDYKELSSFSKEIDDVVDQTVDIDKNNQTMDMQDVVATLIALLSDMSSTVNMIRQNTDQEMPHSSTAIDNMNIPSNVISAIKALLKQQAIAIKNITDGLE